VVIATKFGFRVEGGKQVGAERASLKNSPLNSQSGVDLL
jgi:hypothetical protein